MPKKILVCLLVVLLWLNCLNFWSACAKAENTSLNVNAGAYVLMDAITGRVLIENNSEERRAMASTTKIMTAIIALERGDLTSKVRVSGRASAVRGSSFRLEPGEEMSLESMLYGLLLPSGNDAAVAIAEHIGGSVENFVKLMNQKALEIGAVNTHFMNPHGLDAPGHYTTAKDLALIARYALTMPKFREIVKTPQKEILEGNFPRRLYNTNKLLWRFEGADGVKTGYTGKAGKCLVASATRDGIQLISVVLGTRDHFGNSFNLLSYGFSRFKPLEVVNEGKIYGEIIVENGVIDKSPLAAKYDVLLPVEKGETVNLRAVTPDKIKAPVYKGQEIGELHIYINGKPVYKTPLVAVWDIREKTLFDTLYKILRQWLSLNGAL
ncbi:D-alanyl-D-alanine carboxypeptidase family protein [Thermoanaerobacterium sp. DL9XJH110]|uniref:D-alanyl-D-alanine carboxypeptidase family protein n=1 Tax=Thermoanaerobacterium sp. DL9XJH110 TaxID=3386643 RepID=UPI003BB6AD3B